MTLTLNAVTGGLWIFWGNFGLQDTFQEQIALKSIEIAMEKLHMKFSALNVDFDGPSLDFLGSRKPEHEGIKEQYPRKLLFYRCWKWLQIGKGMLPITTSTSDELFSHINIDDFERLWIFKMRGFIDFLRSLAAAHTPRMNCNEMAGDRLKVCEQELL